MVVLETGVVKREGTGRYVDTSRWYYDVEGGMTGTKFAVSGLPPIYRSWRVYIFMFLGISPTT